LKSQHAQLVQRFLNEKMYPAVCTDEFEQEMNRLFDAIKYSQLSAPEAAAFQFKS